MWKVLLVDDEPRDHAILNLALPSVFELHSCYTAGEAITAAKEKNPHIILLDIDLPDMDGIELLKTFRASGVDNAIFIMVSGYDDPNLIVQSVKAGASDYLVKPYNSETVHQTLKKHVGLSNTPTDPFFPRDQDPSPSFEEFGLIGKSEALRSIRKQIHFLGPSNGTVLITGESGTGKELIAQALHTVSSRTEGPFIPINCSAVPESIFEAELFGSVRGAFTGALDRFGLFETAHQGTLFLDEIGDLPLPLQVKLLRFLEDKEVRQVGGTKRKKLDIRIISATNQDITKAMHTGAFRRDLYYRLNVFRMQAPPLRDRKEDIPLLAHYFLHGNSNSNKIPNLSLSPAALKKLMDYSWPGNIRELKNILERAIWFSTSSEIGPELIQYY